MTDLPRELSRYAEINAARFRHNPLDNGTASAASPTRLPRDSRPLRVAVVGTEPAAYYAAEQMIARGEVDIDMFDGLPAPLDLARYGSRPTTPRPMAPSTCSGAAFERGSVRPHLNVDVGRDISHAELAAPTTDQLGRSANRRPDGPNSTIAQVDIRYVLHDIDNGGVADRLSNPRESAALDHVFQLRDRPGRLMRVVAVAQRGGHWTAERTDETAGGDEDFA